MNFRVDARTQTALQSIATVVLPLPQGFWLVPTLGLGADSDLAHVFILGSEAGSDRSKRIGLAWSLLDGLTIARVLPPDRTVPTQSALSTDFAVGLRRTLVSSYGLCVQLEEGVEERAFPRWGGELSVYGTLF
jgi:hypothetical protein